MKLYFSVNFLFLDISVSTLFQSADQHHSVGTKLLSLVYRSIAPGREQQCLPSLDPSCKRLASGLLELAFAFGGLVGKHVLS